MGTIRRLFQTFAVRRLLKHKRRRSNSLIRNLVRISRKCFAVDYVFPKISRTPYKRVILYRKRVVSKEQCQSDSSYSHLLRQSSIFHKAMTLNCLPLESDKKKIYYDSFVFCCLHKSEYLNEKKVAKVVLIIISKGTLIW